MNDAIEQLLAVASEPIGPLLAETVQCTDYLQRWGALGNQLAEVLRRRNGFYAYESSLLVRPYQHAAKPLGLVEWNAAELWKATYEENLEEVLFFAEDIFGCQFCIHAQAVCSFDPETGQLDEISDSLTGWAKLVLDDFEYQTGYPVAHAWQVQNGPLAPGMRLLPKVLFVLGGKHEAENLYALEDVKGMIFRASIANQLRDVPDGEEIIIEIVNRPDNHQ